MNMTLMKAFWRERFTSPGRLALVVTVVAWTVLLAFLGSPVRQPGSIWMIWPVLILGAGLIGRDISTGVLQLVLARPVRRSEYVFSRWLALGTAAFALGLLGWMITLPFSLAGGGTTLLQSLRLLLEYLMLAFGLAAVITGFSALVPGFGDVALWMVLIGLDTTLLMSGAITGRQWPSRVGQVIMDTIIPHVAIKSIWVSGHLHLYPVASWASTITLSLLIGIVALNRREFSYASAG